MKHLDVEVAGPASSHRRNASKPWLHGWDDLISRSATTPGRLGHAQTFGSVHLLRLEVEMHHLKWSGHSETPSYQFILPTQGRVEVTQHSRRASIKPNHFAVLDTTHPFEVRCDALTALLVVGTPQHQVGIPPPFLQQITATAIGGDGDGDGDIISVVLPMLVRLAGGPLTFSSHGPTRLSRNLTDLFTTALLERLSTTSPTGSVKGSILDIMSFIEANLDDPELSGETIAAAHFISPRYLRKLFEGQQVKVSDWIRIRRLELCRRDLADPMLADSPISAIAARWGFLDAAHFSRLFKATFGQSPSRLRRDGFLRYDPHEALVQVPPL